MGICIAKNCEKISFAKKLCRMHYARKIGQVKKPFDAPPKRIEEHHGMTKTSEYKAWITMKNRCYSDKNKFYHRYGGRGIQVCDSWRYSFISFLNDMGEKPFPEAQIDRINNDGNYEPGNCRWTAPQINARNTCRCKINQEKVDIIRFYDSVSINFFCRLYGVKHETIRKIRLKMSWK